MVACTPSSKAPNKLAGAEGAVGIRPLTSEELLADFDILVTNVNSYYGPKEYKEQKFQVNVKQLAAEFREKIVRSQSEAESYGYFRQFLAKLDDGHVGLQIASTTGGVLTYSLGIFLTPVEGKALVGSVVEGEVAEGTQIEIGDEVLRIDGKRPHDYLPTILKYDWLANPVSAEHFIMRAALRPFYITEMVPTLAKARVEFQKANGQTYSLDLPWVERKIPLKKEVQLNARHNFTVPFSREYNQFAPNSSLAQMGNVNPFFMTPQAQAKYEFQEVKPSAEMLGQVGLTEAQLPKIFAALYAYGGKKILLVRQPTYSPTDFSTQNHLRAYMAIFKEFESQADVLVIDQTHNPGGSGLYCSNFYGLLNDEAKPAPVQMCKADRKWMNSLANTQGITDPEEMQQTLSMAREVEKAYDNGNFLSPALPIFVGRNLVQGFGGWSKPVLVLIDELAGSCGDVFPMLIRDNGRGKLFGKRTMGLGGNVETVVTLPFSQASLSLTRGLFMTYRSDGAYDPSLFVENNGVKPDYPYSHTAQDFRGGFVEYVNQFSAKAIEQIQ